MRLDWSSALALVGALLCLPGCRETSPAGAVPAVPAAVPVLTEPVRVRDVPLGLDAVGSVMPLRTVRLRTQVGGELLATPFKEGARVARGQVLAVIDSRALRARLQQARGSLLRDQALLKNAQIDLERDRGAVHDGAATLQALDAQKALVEQYKGAVMTDEGTIAEIEVQIGFTRIRSPIDGRVGLRQVDAGNVLSAGDASAVAIVETLKPITVVFSVPEDQIERIVAAWHGHRLGVQALDRTKRRVLGHGRLLALDNRVDAQSGTVDLKAIFDNQDGRLFPGQFVNARLNLGTLPAALTVPATALRHGRDGDYLFTVGTDHRASLHAVERGPEIAGSTVVRAHDLHADALVVVEGADRLEDRTLVDAHARPVKDASPETAAASSAPSPLSPAPPFTPPPAPSSASSAKAPRPSENLHHAAAPVRSAAASDADDDGADTPEQP